MTFKQAQDFEYVKYSIAKEFELFQDKIVKLFLFNFIKIFQNLFYNGNKIIPLYSISDIPIGEKDFIQVEILDD